MTIAIQIAALWNSGVSLDKIGLELPQISTFALRRKIEELKASGEIEDRAPVVRTVWTPRLVERLRAYAIAGKSSNEIAGIIGISHGPVLAKLRELAVTDDAIAETLVHTPDPWSPEKIAEFVGLWIGGIETKTIAEKYGITDGAIRKRAASMYRAGDLRMVARGNQTNSQRVKAASAWSSVPEFPSTPIPAMPALPNSRRLTLEELRPRDCRWIDDDDFYCGLTITRGSYCACHAKIVYVSPTKSSNLYSNLVRDNPRLNYTPKDRHSGSMHGCIKSLAIFEAETIVSQKV